MGVVRVSDIDPLLLQRLLAQQLDVEALILVAENSTTEQSGDHRGPAGGLIDRSGGCERFSQVSFLPKLGGVIVKGTSEMIRRLIHDDMVISASSAEMTMDEDLGLE